MFLSSKILQLVWRLVCLRRRGGRATLCTLTTKFRCSQEIPPFDPVDQGDDDDWDTMGEPAERSRSPAPTVEELVSQLTHRSTTVVEP
jgi:hypothetical protein